MIWEEILQEQSMLENICKSIRINVLEMMHRAHGSHIGGCLSVIEILVTLYFKILNVDPKIGTISLPVGVISIICELPNLVFVS